MPILAPTGKKWSQVQSADKCENGNIPKYCGYDRDSLLNITKHTTDDS